MAIPSNSSSAARAERLSRRDLRDLKEPDAFAEALAPYIEAFEKNWKVVAGLAGAAVVLAIGIALGTSVSARHEQRAAQQLGSALAEAAKVVVSGNDSAAAEGNADSFPTEQAKEKAVAEAMQAVIAKAPGSPSATTAELALGDADFRLGKFSDAEAAYAKYLGEAPANDTLRAFALQGQAYALAAEGKGDAALAAAKSLVDSPPGGFGRDVGLLAEGRIAEQLGKPDVARDAYEKLSVDYPTSAAGREANERLTALGVTPEPPKPAALPKR